MVKRIDTHKKELDPQHAEWLAKHRGDNQVISAKLYRLLKIYNDYIDDFGYEVEILVGIAFSLWRSAFLSDKTGYRTDTTDKAISFLAELVQNNAIVFFVRAKRERLGVQLFCCQRKGPAGKTETAVAKVHWRPNACPHATLRSEGPLGSPA